MIFYNKETEQIELVARPAQPISPSVGYFVAWLGYTESALDPILVFMLSSFVNKLVCQTFKVVCGGCGKETKATRSSSPHSFQHV